MEIRYIVLWSVIGCCVWALMVSSLTTVDEIGSAQMFKSELPDQVEGSKFGEVPVDQFTSIIRVLNVAIPLALLGIIFLGVTNAKNPTGIGAIGAIIVLYAFTVSKTMDAADIIQAKSEFSIDARVWWW